MALAVGCCGRIHHRSTGRAFDRLDSGRWPFEAHCRLVEVLLEPGEIASPLADCYLVAVSLFPHVSLLPEVARHASKSAGRAGGTP